MNRVTLTVSPKKDKKFRVTIRKKEKDYNIDFGASGYGDYPYFYKTEGKDFADKKKKNYITRHQKKENWKNIYTSGYWARWVLWNKKSIKKSFEETVKKILK